jgi:c-di-GMP-related signal transduction protein
LPGGLYSIGGREVIAYELPYQNSEENINMDIDANLATSEVISRSFYTIGLDKITTGKKASINLKKILLDGGTAFLLPKELVVIEITGEAEPKEETL